MDKNTPKSTSNLRNPQTSPKIFSGYAAPVLSAAYDCCLLLRFCPFYKTVGMLKNIMQFYDLCQEAIEMPAHEERKVTLATIKEELGDLLHRISNMKFEVDANMGVFILVLGRFTTAYSNIGSYCCPLSLSRLGTGTGASLYDCAMHMGGDLAPSLGDGKTLTNFSNDLF